MSDALGLLVPRALSPPRASWNPAAVRRLAGVTATWITSTTIGLWFLLFVELC